MAMPHTTATLLAASLLAGSALGQTYSEPVQESVGTQPVFHVSGPAADAMATTNLNYYVDIGTAEPWFEFTLEFEKPVRDNDPDPDGFGELLFFERGLNGGNSWLTIQAVDEHGAPLGPPLALSHYETQTTTPSVSVMRADQVVGAVSIDVSRLGVSEAQYIRVMQTRAGVGGFTGYVGGNVHEDRNPDFKFLALITHPDDQPTPLAPAALFD